MIFHVLADGFVASFTTHLLALNYHALEFFKDRKLFVGLVDVGIAFFTDEEETAFGEPFKLALDVAGIFFDKFGETADVCLKVGVFGKDDKDFASHPTCNKNV